MNQGQRTSSAAELRKIPPVPEGFGKSKETNWGTPVRMFEFEPAKEPAIGLVYLKHQSKTVHGDWVIFDGFYLDSRGGRPSIAVIIPEVLIKGTYPEEENIPVTVSKADGGELYFLTRDMAEYCVSKINSTEWTYDAIAKVCHARSFNSLIDHLEDGDQAGHFEDDKVLIVSAGQISVDGKPAFIGMTEMLLNKKLHLVHVVGGLDHIPQGVDVLKIMSRDDLIEPAYYLSEQLARYAYQDRLNGRKPIDNLAGRSFDAIQQHIVRNMK